MLIYASFRIDSEANIDPTLVTDVGAIQKVDPKEVADFHYHGSCQGSTRSRDLEVRKQQVLDNSPLVGPPLFPHHCPISILPLL